MEDVCYTILRRPKSLESANDLALLKSIKSNNLDAVKNAIEELLQLCIDGEKFPQSLLLAVINQYQISKLGSKMSDKKLKKLLYLLWECIPKKTPEGKFIDSLVLVCSALDADLKHPNEYICGNVLRMLAKTTEKEVILELIGSIEKCLDLSTSYQRRNAALAIADLYKNFPEAIPHASDRMMKFLKEEKEDECIRAAIKAMQTIDKQKNQTYINQNLKDFSCLNASIQLLLITIIGSLERNPVHDSAYVELLCNVMRSSSGPTVRFQAANTMMRLSLGPDSIKTVADCFIDVCAKESENNVKLIAIDNLLNLRKAFPCSERILRNSIMDILFILQSATDLVLRQKILSLSVDLVSPLTVSSLIASLKGEIQKTLDSDVMSTHEDTIKYRRLLIETIYKFSSRFPKAIVEGQAFDTLFNLLTFKSVGERTSSRLISLFKVFMFKNPMYRPNILKNIHESFNLVKSNMPLHKGLLWLMGDFSDTRSEIEKSLEVIMNSIGKLPIKDLEKRIQKEFSSDEIDGKEEIDCEKSTKEVKSLVTADGTYATQSAMAYPGSAGNLEDEHPPLRSYILKGKFDFCSILGHAFVKLAYRYQGTVSNDRNKINKFVAKCMLIVASILKMGHSKYTDSENNPIIIDNDNDEQLMLSLSILKLIIEDNQKEVSDKMKEIFTSQMRQSLKMMIKNMEKENADVELAKKSIKKLRVDDEIQISLFKPKDDFNTAGDNLDSITDDIDVTPLNYFNQIPLTGTEDPIYMSCEFEVKQYVIGMKLYLENRAKSQSNKTNADKILENITLELSTRGEMVSNLVEKPEPFLLPPGGTKTINTSVRVSSTENRKLFGSISYDDNDPTLEYGNRERIITLNDININITDYIEPAACSYEEFKDLWRDCEWENKISVKTKIPELREYLDYLIKITNMRCVTPEKALAGQCSFLCANLYAKSSFGEDALVNVSIEKKSPTSPVTGHVKVRSRVQGMALSIGEKIQ